MKIKKTYTETSAGQHELAEGRKERPFFNSADVFYWGQYRTLMPGGDSIEKWLVTKKISPKGRLFRNELVITKAGVKFGLHSR